MSLLITLVYILFVVSAIVLVVVILLQEGKGGGLADVLGTAGQQTFGVGSSGIQKFTAATATIFLVSALLIHVLNRVEGGSTVVDDLGLPGLDAPSDFGAPADTGTGVPAGTEDR
jgi:preprotein translocase subunit SecG